MFVRILGTVVGPGTLREDGNGGLDYGVVSEGKPTLKRCYITISSNFQKKKYFFLLTLLVLLVQVITVAI